MERILERVLVMMRAHVLDDRWGDLPLYWRLRLWRAMQVYFGESASRRRSQFALKVSEQLLPIWESERFAAPFHAYPAMIISAARRFLSGELSKSDIRRQVDAYWRQFEDAVCALDFGSHGGIEMLYPGMIHVLMRVTDEDDELYNQNHLYEDCWADNEANLPTENQMGDPSFWDIHFAGSRATAGFDDSEIGFDQVPKLREYWLNWLDVQLRPFLDDISD